MGDTPGVKGVVGLGTASGVDVDGVVSQGQIDIVVPGGADAAQVANILQVLVEPHNPGDAPLGHNFIEHIRLGHSQLGEGLLQIVEHHRGGPLSADVRVQPLSAEGVGVGVDGLRVGLHRGNGRDAGLIRK